MRRHEFDNNDCDNDASSARDVPLSRRLRGHLELSRISNGPTVVTNVLAAAALAGTTLCDSRLGQWGAGQQGLDQQGLDQQGLDQQGLDQQGLDQLELIALTIALLLIYVGGMYLNDVLDYAFDSKHRPQRPLVRGVVSRKEASICAVAYFVLGCVFLGAVATASLASGLVLIMLVVVYDAWHKTNPVAPWLMGLIRTLVYVTVFSAFASLFDVELWIWGGLLGCYIVGVTALARAETDPDKTSYLAVVMLCAPGIYTLVSGPSMSAALVAAGFLSWIAYCVRHASPAGGRDIGRAIGGLLAGICLLDAMVIASSGQLLELIVALVCFGLTLVFHSYLKGT